MADYSESILISNLTKQVEVKAKKVIDRTLEKVVNELMETSPVGEPDLWKWKPKPDYEAGHYKANWQHTIDSPATEEIEGEDIEGTVTRARMLNNIKNNNKLLTTHYFTNNAKYASTIEYQNWAIHNEAPRLQGHIASNLVGSNATRKVPTFLAESIREVG
jgi:hypothetical protein